MTRTMADDECVVMAKVKNKYFVKYYEYTITAYICSNAPFISFVTSHT